MTKDEWLESFADSQLKEIYMQGQSITIRAGTEAEIMVARAELESLGFTTDKTHIQCFKLSPDLVYRDDPIETFYQLTMEKK